LLRLTQRAGRFEQRVQTAASGGRLGQEDVQAVEADFYQWIIGTFAGASLGGDLAAIERDLGVREAAELERARWRIVYAADSRYAVVDAAVIVAAARG